MIPRWLPLLVAAAVSTGTAGAESHDPPSTAPPDPPADEARCEELARRFEELLADAKPPAVTEVTLVEAQEIARVADELRAEGDPEIAAALLEEAIALLSGGEPAL